MRTLKEVHAMRDRVHAAYARARTAFGEAADLNDEYKRMKAEYYAGLCIAPPQPAECDT